MTTAHSLICRVELGLAAIKWFPTAFEILNLLTYLLESILVLILDRIRSTVDRLGAGLSLYVGADPAVSVIDTTKLTSVCRCSMSHSYKTAKAEILSENSTFIMSVSGPFLNIKAMFCAFICFEIGPLLSTWVVALRAEFDQYVDSPVLVPVFTLLLDWITN